VAFPLKGSSNYFTIESKNFDNLLVAGAITKNQRQMGLMYIKELTDSNGMIFIYKRPKVVKIWMYNTPLPLDIIFVDKNKKVLEIKEGIPYSKKIISSKYPVIAVIEIPRNCSKKIDLEVGDKLYWNELMIKDIKFNNKKKYNYVCLN